MSQYDQPFSGFFQVRVLNPKRKIYKFVFAALLIGGAFAATYTSSAVAFSELDFRQIILFGGAVNVVLLWAALFLLRSEVIANVVLSLVVLAGVATAYVIHTDLFYLAGNRAVLILLCAAACLALFVAFRVIDERHWGGIVLSAAALLSLGLLSLGMEVRDLVGGTPTPVSGDTTNIRHVSFQETPNLYFVSFDAIAPRSLLSKYSGVESTEFHDLVEAKMRRFPNFFADSVHTTHSLNSLLALDVNVYRSQRRELRENGKDPDPFLFSGQNPSPLLSILHDNGYETSSIYFSRLFGKRKGPYIDHYHITSKKTVCNLLDTSIRNLSFWGYCRLFGGRYGGLQRLTAEQVVKVSGQNDGPQFVMAHLSVPGHTAGSFRYGNVEQFERFIEQYIRRSEKAARYLELIIRHLERKDPDAILLVYGDHGPLVSRGLEFKDDPKFVVQDNYGVLGAVYPRDTCASWFDEVLTTQGYMTILDMLHTLLRCLSGGESALIEPRKRALHGYGPISWRNLDYRWFLYESKDPFGPVSELANAPFYQSILSAEPVIRSTFDVHLSENVLVYVKKPCARTTDTEAVFFLHLIPASMEDLPDDRRQYGFDNLDFHFDRQGVIFDDVCLARALLPDYDITSIRTGQYIPGAGKVWKAQISLPRRAE